jgi:predicted house-cleaning NTP pyrophosphatase (Maf/HAM1 superfamily)
MEEEQDHPDVIIGADTVVVIEDKDENPSPQCDSSRTKKNWKILEKPRDPVDAEKMLREYTQLPQRNQTHTVITAVTLIYPHRTGSSSSASPASADDSTHEFLRKLESNLTRCELPLDGWKEVVFFCRTEVVFSPLASAEEIRSYVSSGQPMYVFKTTDAFQYVDWHPHQILHCFSVFLLCG